MSSNCDIGHPLVRDGRSQRQRHLRTLMPDYVKVDERSINDLIAFTETYSDWINYYDDRDKKSGDWRDFFDRGFEKTWRITVEVIEELRKQQLPETVLTVLETLRGPVYKEWQPLATKLSAALTKSDFEKYEETILEIASYPELNADLTPHYALFIVFLELFSYAQEHLNQMTQRHLDFYYQQALQLKRKAPVPDQVHVVFELAKNVKSHLVKKQVGLKGGKDVLGKPLTYHTDKDIVVNRAEVKELKTIYRAEYASATAQQGVYAASKANSADGKGAELKGTPPSWPTFGEDQKKGGVIKLTTMERARIGFGIASPLFYLKEGERTITVDFTISGGAFGAQQFLVDYTGENGWVQRRGAVTLAAGSSKLEFTLDESYAPVVAYNEEIHKSGYGQTLPMIRFTLRDNNNYVQQDLHTLATNQVVVTVDVKGVKDLVLQNDLAALDPTKPFEPFGPRPSLESAFYVGCDEAFSKPISEFYLDFKWLGDLNQLYHIYSAVYTPAAIRTPAFTAHVEVLAKGDWALRNSTYKFLEMTGAAAQTNKITVGLNAFQERYEKGYTGESRFDEFEHGLKRGFVRMVLKSPKPGERILGLVNKLEAFGHSQFPQIYAKEAIRQSRLPNTIPPTAVNLPKEPYTPKVQSMTLNYKASETIALGTARSGLGAYQSTNSRFMNIGPFGGWETHPYLTSLATDGASAEVMIFPSYNLEEGALYIGVENLQAPQNLTLLFQLLEGSGDPTVGGTPKVKWSYLRYNSWQSFENKDVLSDSTDDLTTSGIVELSVSDKIRNGNNRVNKDLFWIRATSEKTKLHSRVISVQTQAVRATFKNDGNDPNHLSTPLPAKSISKLLEKQSEIKSLEQPYVSFNGKREEGDAAFYTRVSERLRHKNRAITLWDYEQLVLDAFPEVYKVKCLNHTDVDKNLAPGHVTLVVIANVRNKNNANPLRPLASVNLLTRIKNQLDQLNSGFTKLHVELPLFEEIEVDFKVKFRKGTDQGYAEKKLNKEIVAFLSPWAFKAGEDIAFNGTIYKSSIINFVEERSYVDFVTCFKMYHYKTGSNTPDEVEEVTASKPRALLVSVAEHKIEEEKISVDGECECETNVVSERPLNKACN